MSTISLTTFALFSLLVIPSFPFYKSIHPLNLIPLNGPFVELLFNKIIFPFPIPHCNNRKSIFIGFFVIICMNQIAFFCVIKRSEEHTSELQSRFDLVCRLLLEKKKIDDIDTHSSRS